MPSNLFGKETKMADDGGRAEQWGLFPFYPLAAFLVLLSLQVGALPNNFRRDWPHILAGPIGVAIWWAVAHAWHSWPALIGGYLVGMSASVLVVISLREIVGRFFRKFD